jgi:hypothetical protein
VNRLGILLSSTYIDEKLALYYGAVPPSFLPVSGKRLYRKQIEVLSESCNKIVLTLPANYILPTSDAIFLKEIDVDVLRLNVNLSIGEAIKYVLLTYQDYNCAEILYGDTLVFGSLSENEFVLVKKPNDEIWGSNRSIGSFSSKQGHDRSLIMAGRFCLSDCGLFITTMSDDNFEIMTILERYNGINPFQYFETDLWYDFGHLSTIQKSILSVPESRHFNNISVLEDRVRKSSVNSEKLLAEVSWYLNIPDEYRKYTAAITNTATFAYEIEYISDPTFQELLIFGNFSEQTWRNIFRVVVNYFHHSLNLRLSDDFASTPCLELRRLVEEKTKNRVSLFLNETSSLEDFDSREIRRLLSEDFIDFNIRQIDFFTDRYLGFFHGDMCASNIFWNPSNDSLKLIDPRGGGAADGFGIIGDIRYDVAKLYQSFVLGYDFVMKGRYNFIEARHYRSLVILDDEKKSFFELEFNEMVCKPLGIRLSEIHSISLLLLVGLLPLHSDRPDRQNAFMHIIRSVSDK